MKKYHNSFMLARFQPLHNGHKSIIDKMIKESDNITIILGSAQESCTKKNPLNVEQRQELIENLYGKKDNIKILSLDDIDCDEDYWYKHVLQFLKEKVPEFGAPDAYYCGDMENGKYYDKGEFKIEIIKRENQKGLKKISATEIREMIQNHDDNWKKYIPKKNINLIEKFLYKE